MDERSWRYWREGDVVEMAGSCPPGVLEAAASHRHAGLLGHRPCARHACCTSIPDDDDWSDARHDHCAWYVRIRYAIKRPDGPGGHISVTRRVPRDGLAHRSSQGLFDREPVAIVRNATLDSIARRLQHAFRRCVADPHFALCRRRSSTSSSGTRGWS